MLHIIGLILKIIGILLLAVLGLLLLVLLIVLLVPVRYRVKAEHGDKLLTAEGRVHWLLHLVNVRFTYLEGVFHIRAGILWFTIYDNLKPKAPKKPKSEKTSKGEKISKSEKTSKGEKISKAGKTTKVETTKALKKAEAVDRLEARISELKKKTEKSENSKMIEKKKEAVTSENVKKSEPDGKIETTMKPGASGNTVTIRNTETPGETEKAGFILEDKRPEPVAVKPIDRQDNDDGKEAGGLFDKIIKCFKEIIEKIKSFMAKVHNLIDKVKAFREGFINKIKSILESAADIKRKAGLIFDFIKDEYNKQGFRITFASLKKLLKHILPTKLRSRIVFGTGDPCSTGQALGAMSILYSFYGDKIQIVPDFENQRLEGKHYARGRIRLVTILIIVIKLILDKRFKHLRMNFQILKEAL